MSENLTTNLVCNHDEARSLAHYKRENSNLARCYLALDIEVAELRRDAERYRWLKANHLQTGTDSWIRTGEDLEEAIDAALGEQP